MKPIYPNIVFISGLGGTGKSTLVAYFKKYPMPHWKQYDFDKGKYKAPRDLSKHHAWREKQTDYWLNVACTNSKKNINTIVFGMCLYPKQILKRKPEKMNSKNVHFAYLYCSPTIRRKRLVNRGNPDHWRGYRFPWHIEFHAVMKKDCEKKFDTTKFSLPQTANKIKKWLEKL